MKDFFLYDKKYPKTTDKEIMKYVIENKLHVGVQIHLEPSLLSYGNDFAAEQLDKHATERISNQIISKMKKSFRDDPISNAKIFKGEIICMTEDQLTKLLADFGVDIYKVPSRD